jgi:hemerythrin superfamily protein
MNKEEIMKLQQLLKKALYNIEYMQWSKYLKKHGIVRNFLYKKLFTIY